MKKRKYVCYGIMFARFQSLKAKFIVFQEEKDFDEVRESDSDDDKEDGVEADTTMTLQGGVSIL